MATFTQHAAVALHHFCRSRLTHFGPVAGARARAKLAKALDVDVRELFTFPERGSRDRAIDLLSTAKPESVRRALRLLAAESDEP